MYQIISAATKYSLRFAIMDCLYDRESINEEDKQEFTLCFNYVRLGLNLSVTKGDLFLIFPPAFHSCIEDIVTLQDDTTTLTNDEVAKFNCKHSEELETVRQRLVLKLLES